MRGLKIYRSCLCLGLLALGIISCGKHDRITGLSHEELVLSHVRDIVLPLDSQTSSLNNFYKVIEKDSTLILVFFNPLNYSLYTFDLASQEFISKAQFDKEGPNGLGSMVTSFTLFNDSSVVFHSYYRAELIYARMDGEVNFRYKLRNEEFSFTPQTWQNTPFVMFDEALYIYSGQRSNAENSTDVPMLLKHSFADSLVMDTGIRLPFFYKTSSSRYLPRKLSELTLGMNRSNKTVLASFPLDDSIRVVGVDEEVATKYFGSPEHKVGKSLSKAGGPTDSFTQMKDLLRFSRYGSINYDPYRELYFRTFFEGIPEKLLESNKLKSEQKILIANKEFEILGVADFLGTDQLFFTKEGLLQIILSTSQEDSLRIKVFDYEF